jgi:hypothetical protein
MLSKPGDHFIYPETFMNHTPIFFAFSAAAALALPPQTMQHCLTAKDVEGNKALEMPANPDSDCKMRDLTESGGQFSYKVSCTKPQKLDGAVKGTFTSTTMNMDMTMSMANVPGPMTQTISAKRVGDCKQ